MKNLSDYMLMIWNGGKMHSLKSEIENWCEEMELKNYTINSQGEIDVDGDVDLRRHTFKELPHKFGKVTGYFTLMGNKNLISLKNCPNEVGNSFDVDDCIQ